MAEISNVTVRVDAVITDEQYHEAMSAVSAANEYIAALEAENAKLREQLEKSEEGRERQADNLINKCHTIARLQADNAKLRKLVRDMDECFRIGALSVKGISRQWCRELFVTYRNRMRELGVES